MILSILISKNNQSPAYDNVGDLIMSKESFKSFVRNKPELVRYVRDQKTSWQKLYEIYELYGENSSVWNDYLKGSGSKLSTSFSDIINTIKGIDLEKLQNGIDSIQNTISLIQNFGNNKVNTNNYEPRYHYQRMDD